MSNHRESIVASIGVEHQALSEHLEVSQKMFRKSLTPHFTLLLSQKSFISRYVMLKEPYILSRH